MFRLNVFATTPSLLITGTACDENVLMNLGLMLEMPFSFEDSGGMILGAMCGAGLLPFELAGACIDVVDVAEEGLRRLSHEALVIS